MYNNRTFGQKLSAFNCLSSVGIDKLSVVSTDFEIENVLPLAIYGELKRAGMEATEPNKLFTTKGGQPVFGSKAILNTEAGNYTIQNGVMTVNCNPSKVFFPAQTFRHGSKVVKGSWQLLTEPEQLQSVIEAVEADARRHGICFDFGNSKTYRLDLAKQNEMSRPFADYIPALESLKMKYTKSNNIQHGTQTYQYGTTASNTVVCLYDKEEELLKAEKVKSFGSNFLRCELRILNARTVRNLSNCQTPNDIVRQEPEQRKQVFEDYLSKRLFYGQAPELFTNEQSLRSLVEHYATEDTKRPFQKVVQTIGVQTICELAGIEAFLKLYCSVMAKQTNATEESIGRNLRRYRNELHRLAGVSSSLYKPVKVVELLTELREALLVA